ncbi:ankyrin repeat domain-containing protein [Vampirovibrio sp.]|uniref:ankyrin repeat domain-containing protein n=1 Tax=Vampirovibrio sp. TaxID=2717857 RepID=UPI0035943E91
MSLFNPSAPLDVRSFGLFSRPRLKASPLPAGARAHGGEGPAVGKVENRAFPPARAWQFSISQDTFEAFSTIPEPEFNRLNTLKNTENDSWRMLLNKTALCPDYRDCQGFAPLHYTAFIDDRTTARSLLQMGAKPDVLSHHGESPLMLAAMRGNVWLAGILLRHQADPNYRYEAPWPQSPMVYAAREGQVDVLALLLAQGITPQNKNEALAGAARYGHLAAVDLLLNNGADVNQKDAQGFGPLMLALRSGSPDAEKVGLRLVEAGANVHDKVQSTGKSALYLAEMMNYTELAQALKQAGAKSMDGKKDQGTPFKAAGFKN